MQITYKHEFYIPISFFYLFDFGDHNRCQTHLIFKQHTKSYPDIGTKVIMLPNNVLATILLCDKSIIELAMSQSLISSSARSLYENEPYKNDQQ